MDRDTRKKILRTFFHNKAAVLGLAVSLMVVAVCLAAPWLPLPDPVDQSMAARFKAPGPGHLMGTDNFGRDVLSRVIWGGRISLLVGVLSVGLAMVLGTVIGLVAAYKGGLLENLVMRVVDVLMCFPTLIWASSSWPPWLGQWRAWWWPFGMAITPRFARLCRGAVLSVKESDFVEAARSWA